MAYIPKSDSVVAFQSKPSSMLVGASIIGVVNSKLYVDGNPVDGSNPVPVMPPASGFLNVATQGTSIVTASQGSVAAVIIGGSIAASFTPPVNQSVSGTVVATQIAGSVLAVSGTFTPAANQSVSGTVGTSMVGGLYRSNTAFKASVHSGVPAWGVRNEGNVDLSGTDGDYIPIAVDAKGHIIMTNTEVVDVRVVSSVAAVQSGTRITSVMSTIPSSMLVGASAFGVFPVTQSGAWSVSVTGTLPPQSVSGTVGASVIGTVPMTMGPGTWITSVVSTNPSSMLVGASIIGLTPVTVNGQVGTQVTSIVGGSSVFQYGSWSTSIIGGASVFQAGTWKSSIASNYAVDSASVISAIGDLILGVRNDTMATLTNADGDYTPWTIGPAGENIVANAPLTKWVQGTANIVAGPSVQAIAPQGTSVFTYITGLQVANMSANNVLVTLTGGLGSVLGYTIAPANGGSNIVLPNALKTGANSGFSASISGVASVYLSAQGFVSKT